MDSRFAGRVGIVTGAAKGMGLATAVELARDGASVVITDIDAKGPRGGGRRRCRQPAARC